jgi:beta-lactamase class A
VNQCPKSYNAELSKSYKLSLLRKLGNSGALTDYRTDSSVLSSFYNKKRWPKRRRKKGHLTSEDDGYSNFKGRMRENP